MFRGKGQEMVQVVKCWLYMHEDLGSDPQNHGKSTVCL